MTVMCKPLKAVRSFSGASGIEEFARRHKAGTEAEFTTTQRLVDQINKEDNKFLAWVISKTRETPKRLEYLIIVQPGQDGERKIPQQGEPGRLRIVFGDNDCTRYWDARRIENPLANLNIKVRSPEKIAAYQVTVHIADAHNGVQPLIDTSSTPKTSRACTPDTQPVDGLSDAGSSNGDSGIGDCNANPSIVLTDENSVRVNFHLTASEATKNAEIYALEQFCGRYKGNVSERQQKAFEYFVQLRDPAFSVNLHELMPHLTSVMDDPSWLDSPLAKKFDLLNPQQKAAYLEGFLDLPCGMCILPGGPGAGKTHFNLFTVAMAQSRPLPPRPTDRDGSKKRFAKVLFIVDMNCPVDDVANRMMRLYKELGMNKLIIRMKGWGAELVASDRLNAAKDAARGDEMLVDFTNQFLRTRDLMSLSSSTGRRSCQAPSLDEAAWQRYDEHKTTVYAKLTEYLEGELWETSDLVPLALRRMIYRLYRDTLAAADFIATTPVAASNHFRGMFKPDLVYFDESPHARELTNLIAIANFNPIAWIFCGDYRQTVPYVSSNGDNEYREQIQVSMMERAAVAKAIPYELLMNHRAFGGLQKLASTMFYGGRMVTGNEGRTPESLIHMRQYLGHLTGRPCTVPRALVHLRDCGPEARDGTSAWNPSHTAWFMARARELLRDPEFQGTILIMAFYKKAYNEYKKEIQKLSPSDQRRIEARTVDVAQGHEADVVFIDLVKETSTKFLDDPNRLNVALTRGRVGEIIMMHPNMVHSENFRRHSRYLRPMYNFCKDAGQVVFVGADADTTAAPSTPSSPASASRSAAANAVTESSSDVSDCAVSVTDGVCETQASNVSEDSAPAVEQMVPVVDQAPQLTHLIHEDTEKAIIDESATPDVPVRSPTSASDPVCNVAPIDDGELWWNTVMNRSTLAQVVPAEEKAVTIEEKKDITPQEAESVATPEKEESVVIAEEEERPTIFQASGEVEVTSITHEVSEPLTTEETAAMVPVESRSTENNSGQEVAPIDDGQLWWDLAMNRRAQVQVVAAEEKTVAAAEEAKIVPSTEQAEDVATSEEEGAIIPQPRAEVELISVAHEVSEPPAVEVASAIAPIEEASTTVSTQNTADRVPTKDPITTGPVEEPATIIPVPFRDAESKDRREVAPIDDGELWWDLVMNRSAQLHAVTTDDDERPPLVQPAAEEAATDVAHNLSEIVAVEDTAAVVLTEAATTIAPPEETATTVPSEETAVIVPNEHTTVAFPAEEPSTTVPIEEAVTSVPTEETTTVVPPEETSAITLAEETAPIPQVVSSGADDRSVPEVASIDDGELWWNSYLTMKASAQIATEKKESAPAAHQSPAVDTVTSLAHELGEEPAVEKITTVSLSPLTCTIEDEAVEEATIIDDGEYLSNPAMNGPVHMITPREEEEVAVEAQPPAEDDTTNFTDDISETFVVEGTTTLDLSTSFCAIETTPIPSVPVVFSIAGDNSVEASAVAYTIGDTPTPVVPDTSCTILGTPSSAATPGSDTVGDRDTTNIANLDDSELWWSQAVKGLAQTITAKKEVGSVPKPRAEGGDTETSPNHDIMKEPAGEPTTSADPAASSTMERTETPIAPAESSITETEADPIKNAEDEVWTHAGDDAADELDKKADEMIKLAEQMRNKAAEIRKQRARESAAAETDRLAEQSKRQKAEETMHEVSEMLMATEKRLREEADRACKKAEEEARRVVDKKGCKQHEEDDGLVGLAMLIAQVLRWGWEHQLPTLRN